MVTDIASLCRRLGPGEDLYESLLGMVATHRLDSGVVVSLVGSLTQARLRLAGASEATEIVGPLEIVSATGTLSQDGLHVHLSVADAEGTTRGGHLLPGNVVFTTVEVVLLNLSGQWRFERRHDERTGYPELSVFARD